MSTQILQADGIQTLPSLAAMSEPARRVRAFHAMQPGAPLMRREFGFAYCREAWEADGLAVSSYPDHFLLEDDGLTRIGGLGWCEAAFHPAFEEKILERRGDHEVVQDHAGRKVLCFAGRRHGFMPEYLDHPVKDRSTWERDVRWRLDPDAPGRNDDVTNRLDQLRTAAAEGRWMVQHVIGGYMYLRSLIGPEGLLYAVHDDPGLIDDCMRIWFDLADRIIAIHQRHVSLDEIFLAEDICYNKGLLISPAMMRRFLLPWYHRLLERARERRLDPLRPIHLHIDTDGDCRPAIPVYAELGLHMMSPFEVASGCDVVEIGRDWPDLRMLGGMDKRILAKGRPAIDAMVERILPPMRARGGFIPTIDHGIPAEVPWRDYRYYRERCVTLGG